MSDGRQASGAPPDWSLVTFPVGCARCGHDLRELNEPECPACKLRFDWADAAPIEHMKCPGCGYRLLGLPENRCPECGRRFDWNVLLLTHRHRNRALFEHRWRDRLVRSLIGTWWRTFRPREFWSGIDIHDPPQVGPLAALNLIAAAVFWAALPVLVLLVKFVWPTSWQAPQWFGGGYNRLATGSYNPVWDLVAYALTASTRSPLFAGTARYWLFWWGLSFAALLVFRQSMRRCRIRLVHVWRVCVYGVFLPSCAVPVVACLLRGISDWAQPYTPALWCACCESLVIVACLVHVTRSLYWAYARYLGMPHAWAVALASQVIAVLASVTLAVAAGGINFIVRVQYVLYEVEVGLQGY